MIHTNKGFSLIELLAVVLIIGILSSIALPQYRRSIQRAESVEGLTHTKAILEAAMRYYAAYDSYPEKLQGLDVAFYNASSQTDATTDIDNFKLTFAGDGITMCRLPSATPCATYYFKGHYNHATWGKAVITCTYVEQKYKHICEQFGTVLSGSTYLVK